MANSGRAILSGFQIQIAVNIQRKGYAMKTLISLGMAAFVLGFVFSADLAAGVKETEMMLIKQGWVKLTAKELKAMTNFTGSDCCGWAEYIDPSGTKFVTRFMNGVIAKGKREITADGRYCHHYEMGTSSCRFLWKQGKDYLRLSLEGSGAVAGQFTIKPGNTENL